MVSRRTPISRPTKAQFTPEIVAMFRRGREIREAGLIDTWEDDGGCRREYLDICCALRMGLGQAPWDLCIFDVNADAADDDEPPASVIAEGEYRIKEWRMAAKIRRELESVS